MYEPRSASDRQDRSPEQRPHQKVFGELFGFLAAFRLARIDHIVVWMRDKGRAPSPNLECGQNHWLAMCRDKFL